MSERDIGHNTQRLAIFCPADRILEATWLADNKLLPLAIRQTAMAGDKGQRIDGVNIHVQGDPDQIKELFLSHLGWEPQVFKVDGEHFDP